MIRELVLLRHGETDWNADLRVQGHLDIPLNAVGVGQAAAAAPSVAALKPDIILSSDLSRAKATADAVAARTGLPVAVDKRLRETALGQWEGLRWPEVMQRWPERAAAWRRSDADASPPGGETRLHAASRAAEVVAEFDAGTAERVLLVAHGGVIAGLTSMLLRFPEAAWRVLVGLNNCHWVVLHRNTGQWRLYTYNAGLGGVVLPGGEEQIAGM